MIENSKDGELKMLAPVFGSITEPTKHLSFLCLCMCFFCVCLSLRVCVRAHRGKTRWGGTLLCVLKYKRMCIWKLEQGSVSFLIWHQSNSFWDILGTQHIGYVRWPAVPAHLPVSSFPTLGVLVYGYYMDFEDSTESSYSENKNIYNWAFPLAPLLLQKVPRPCWGSLWQNL